MNNNSVSIIINTLNRAEFLKKTLESLRLLDYQNFEVVVVNGPSTDETSSLLLSWEPSIRIGYCPEANLSMSRNIGIAMAKGEFVAFIDDDAIPEAEWLCQAIAGFDSEEIAATGGKVFDHTGYKYQYQYAKANRLGEGIWHLTKPSPDFCFPYSFEFPYLQGTNMLFRRQALIKVGGFDEEFSYYLDETEVFLRLIDEGYFIRQLPNAYVHHKYAPSYIRTMRSVVYRYPVLKSKIYFANRHAKSYLSVDKIEENTTLFIQHHRNDVEANIRAGNLSESDRDQFEEHVILATQKAKQAAAQLPKTISSKLLSRYETSVFKPFATLLPDNERKLVIVLLCEDYPPSLLGGIARFTKDKATALAALGHKVHVIARSYSYNTVDLEEGVWVHRIIAKPVPLTAKAAELKIPQSQWDQSSSYLEEIDRIATHHSVDVVEGPIWNVTGIAVLLSGRYQIITSLQTTLKLSLPFRTELLKGASQYENFILPLINAERIMIEKSDYILASSQSILEQVEKNYGIKILPSKLAVVNYGMLDWRKQLAPMKKLKRKIRILFVGRFEARKGIDTLLAIIPRLCKINSQMEFDLVGDYSIVIDNDKTFKENFELTAPRQVKDRVKFHGKLSDDELKQCYADCDIFVAPSRFESFGLIYLEAMMFAKPVVGCRVGGIPEVVIDGESGLLAEPGDEDSLYHCIKKLIEDEALRSKLGANGRARYEQFFSVQEMAKKCVEIYLSQANLR